MEIEAIEMIGLINKMDDNKLHAYWYSNHTKFFKYIQHVIEVNDWLA